MGGGTWRKPPAHPIRTDMRVLVIPTIRLVRIHRIHFMMENEQFMMENEQSKSCILMMRQRIQPQVQALTMVQIG
jgi:hypothetical protein